MINEKTTWKSFKFFNEKFNLSAREFQIARKNGLPYREKNGVHFYREKDINDYYSGRVGKDVGKTKIC